MGLYLFITTILCSPSFGQAISKDELARVKAIEQARISVINKVYGSVVAIYGLNRQGGGSGVIYDPQGYALTNYHVVKGAGVEGWAGLADGKLYKWKLIGLDPGGDLAIIKLQGKDHFPHSVLADSDTVRVGDFAMAMGNPFVLADDQKPTVTMGVVSGVKRYQPGTGSTGTLLVYGNCIQIDSSINPGNSGGPLFNMRGQVVGINGRGSFEERGRVNVGVGYAISINQAKAFLPDMLATKVAQHATLDATFAHRGDYGGNVVCTAIDLDSIAAKNGLQLGDRLIQFDGVDIRNANELTNHLSTLPAGWPVSIIYERKGKRAGFWQRLEALAYPKAPSRPARPQPAPKNPDKEQPEAPPEKKPKKQDNAKGRPRPAPRPGQRPAAPAPVGEPGKIRDAKINHREAVRVLRQWIAFQGGYEALDKAKVMRTVFQMRRADGTDLGESRSVSTMDGRFRIESRRPDAPNGAFELNSIWDGQTYWKLANGKVEISKADEAKRKSSIAMGRVLATIRMHRDLDAHFKKIILQGSDKALNQPAYRLLIEDKIGNHVLLWFSVMDQRGQLQTRLLKTSLADQDGDPTGPMTVYDDYRKIGGIRVAHQLWIADGIAERPIVVVTTKSTEILKQLPKNSLKIPIDPTTN